MTTSVDKLREARERYTVAWTEFLNAYGRSPSNLYCFFEGEDAKYYGIRVRSLTGRTLTPIRCGGVDAVVEIRRLISTQYPSAIACFFVDRDYFGQSVVVGDDRVYITPVYSIENFYVTESAFTTLIDEEFGFSPDDPDRAKVLSLYRSHLATASLALTELNSWLRAYKSRFRRRVAGKLMSVKFSTLLHCDLQTVTKRYTRENLIEWFPEIEGAEAPELEAHSEYIVADPLGRGRGKFLLQFLARFLRITLDDIGRATPQFFLRRRAISLQVDSNLLSTLSQYADTPDCLRRYLELQMRYWAELSLSPGAPSVS